MNREEIRHANSFTWTSLWVGYQRSHWPVVGITSKAYEELQVQKQELAENVVAWAEVSADVSNLTDSLDTLRGFNLWNNVSADSSDESKLTATATSSALNGSYTLSVSTLAQAHSIGSDMASTLSSGADSSTDLVAAGVLTEGDEFTIGGESITIGSTESLSSLRTKILDAAASMSDEEKVSATIIDNRLIINRDQTGSTEITATNTTGTPLDDLGVLSGGSFKNELLMAQDAAFTLNGLSISRSSNTNLTDVLENVTLNLHDETEVGTDISLSISRDTHVVKTAVLEFLDAYNALTSKLDAFSRIELGDDDETQVGILQNDSLAREILTNLRKEATDAKFPALNATNASYINDGSTGIMDSLEDIGIWTTSRDNQLNFSDEDRFDSLLESEFETVEQLFRGVADSSGLRSGGVAADFYSYSDSVSASLTGDIARRINRLNEQDADFDERIEQLTDNLEVKEERLFRQFAAMESSVSQLQGELAFLQARLG